MPRPRERGRSRTRRGKSRSWSPPNPRFDRDISPDSRDVVHYSRGQRRSTARSPSPLTNAPSVGETAGESETEASNHSSDDDASTRHERQRQSKKGKSIRFKNRNYESGHIAGKIESAAVEHVRELNELAKRLSLCALVMSSSDDDSEEDSSDEDAISVKKRPSKSKRKSRSHKRDEKKRSNRHHDDEDEGSLGSAKLVSRRKARGKSMGRPQPSRGRSQTPNDRHHSRPYHTFEGRQEQNQRRLSERQGGYEGREGSPDEYRHQSGGGRHQFWRPGTGTGIGGDYRARMTSLRGHANNIRRAMPSTRCFDDGMLHCTADNMSTTGQSVHGRSLGRYGQRAAIFPRRPDAPIIKQVRLPPGPLGINVTSSARGPLVASVNGHAKVRGIQEGDVLTEIDGRDITGMSAPEVIALFRATRAKNRVVTIRRVRRSGIM